MLCDSGSYIVEASVCSEASCETGYSKMPSNETLEASSPRLIDPDLKPSLGHFTSTSSDYAINRAKASKHPNIQHHPTIHPHSRYQRTLLNTLNRSIISENSSQPSNLNNLDQKKLMGLPCFVIKKSPIWWSGPGHRVSEH
ncbi:hypothetical protein BpHYR1_023502 [Brachionus plicatilis]|uniref:Uncharacterized protein n=1 Tax=Brachionus plicatilis TaxID=10195 RepID=A0A3M7Q6H4_BRAPC|nr:hypothetical protein BpHYR1_023502 [Brachionus plicatilis]